MHFGRFTFVKDSSCLKHKKRLWILVQEKLERAEETLVASFFLTKFQGLCRQVIKLTRLSNTVRKYHQLMIKTGL